MENVCEIEVSENLNSLNELLDTAEMQALLDIEEDSCAECGNGLTAEDDHDICWSCIRQDSEDDPKAVIPELLSG